MHEEPRMSKVPMTYSPRSHNPQLAALTAAMTSSKEAVRVAAAAAGGE